MKYLIYLILILVVLAVNIEITELLAKSFFHVNLLLILCVLSAMEKNHYDFLFFTIVSGLILDIYSPQNFGSFSLSFLLIAWLVNWVVKNFLVYEINLKVSVILLGLSYVFSELLFGLGVVLLHLENSVTYSQLGWLNFSFYQIGGMVMFLLLALPLYFVWQRVSWLAKKLDLRAIS
jgi:cell shape-determining protein MreD